MPVLRNIDLLLLALALPVFVLSDAPLAGWLAGAIIWLVWRGIGAWAEAQARSAGEVRRIAVITTMSMLGRGWLLILMLLAVGLLVDEDTGLAAAVLVLVLFSASFVAKLALRPASRQQPTT